MIGEAASPTCRSQESGATDRFLIEDLSFVTVQETDVAVVATLARPEKCNAISRELIGDLDVLVQRLLASSVSKPFVLRGAGKWFASGGDVRQFSTFTSDQALEMAHAMSGVLRGIESLPGPTIAALNGPAIGGGIELALAFDIRVASTSAYLRFAQSSMGIVTGWQGVERLGHLVGYSDALYLLLSGKEVSAEEAVRRGLVSEVWPAQTFDADLETFLQSICRSTDVGLAIKRVLRESTVRPELSTGDLERGLLPKLWDRPERREAMTSALASRKRALRQSSQPQASMGEKSGQHPIEGQRDGEYTAPQVPATSALLAGLPAPRPGADDVVGEIERWIGRNRDPSES